MAQQLFYISLLYLLYHNSQVFQNTSSTTPLKILTSPIPQLISVYLLFLSKVHIHDLNSLLSLFPINFTVLTIQASLHTQVLSQFDSFLIKDPFILHSPESLPYFFLHPQLNFMKHCLHCLCYLPLSQQETKLYKELSLNSVNLFFNCQLVGFLAAFDIAANF